MKWFRGTIQEPMKRMNTIAMTQVGRPEGVLKVGEMETIANVFSGPPHTNSADRGASSLKEELEVEVRDYLIIR